MPDATSAPVIPPGGDGPVPSRVVKWREAPPVSQDPTPELEPFPLDAFPPLVRDFLLSCAASARVPVEVAAAPFLAIAGAVIGAFLRLEVSPGWIERPVLWIAVVGPTGAGKTPALAAVRRPLDALQRRLAGDYAAEREAWEAAIIAWERRGRADPRPDLYTPRPDRVVTADTTFDNLLAHLRAGSPGLCLFRDELVGIVRGMERRRGHRGDVRQAYLSLWSHGPVTAAGRDTAAHVLPFPVVTIVGGIQPQVLATIRSKDHDGLLERFLPIVTTAQDAYWTETEPASAAALGDIDAITDLFITLRDWPEEPTGEGLIIQRTPAARKIWAAWYNRNIDRITALSAASSAASSAAPSASRSVGPGMPDRQAGLPVEGFYRKLPAHVARIALVLHALWNPGAVRDPLSATTMTHATRIGECLRTHIDRAAHLIDAPPRWSPPKPTLAQRALRVLANADTPDGWLGRTVLYERLSRPHPEELTRTLEHLAAHDLVTVRRITHPRSRKPVEQWRYVN